MSANIEIDPLHWIPAVPANNDYPDKYKFACIESIEELKSIISKYQKEDGTYPVMGFDTETTGLNPEEDYIVGYSFSFTCEDGYYVPVEHHSLALGKEALDIIYEVMTKSERVLMYNARFDIRMMEWYKFCDETFEFKKDFIDKARQYYAYNMDKVKTYDIQVMVWAMDTAHYMPKLKWAELQFLGWRSNTFAETEGDASNFGMLDPREPNTYQYAATDAMALNLLYNLKCFRELRDNEAGISLLMHAEGKIMPLTRFEETPIYADIDLLKRQSEYFHNKLDTIEHRIYNIVGYEFNISSGPSRAKAFKDKNIIITETTESGAIATGASILEKIQRNFEKDSEQYMLIDLCIEYLHLKKMLSTYVDSLLEQVTINSPDYRVGLFRYSYRLNSTVSGRYSLVDVPKQTTDNNKSLSLYESVISKKETVEKYEKKLSISNGKLLGIYKCKNQPFKRLWLLVYFEDCGHTCLIRSDSTFRCPQKDCHDKYFSESQKRAKNTPEWKAFCSNWSKQYYANTRNRLYHKQKTIEGMHEPKHWNNFIMIMNNRFNKPSSEFINNYINGKIKEQRHKFNKDEIKFINLLEDNNIEYIWQYGLYDKDNNKIFIVDFYLPQYNKYVEIDGGSHNRPEKQKRDKLLDTYCATNNLGLFHLSVEQLDKDSITFILGGHA